MFIKEEMHQNLLKNEKKKKENEKFFKEGVHQGLL